MGSKRKEKEEMKIKDEGRSKRHRTDDDDDDGEERKSRKGERKEKRHKHRSSDKEKKKKDKHKSDRHKGDRHLKLDIQELTSDDYFLKNNEFATWLKEEKDIFFSDLSSESSRKLFQDFVEAWNSQALESRYYEGITTGPRTAHNWKIRK